MVGDEVQRAAEALAKRLEEPPELFLALGSGLVRAADAIIDAVEIPASEVAGLPRPSVRGHVGLLRAGRLGGMQVLAQLGRVHLYEGYSPAEVTRAVEVAAELGCATFVVTNCAGGLDQTLEPGDLVAIRDQLNLTAASPLAGRAVGPGGREEGRVFVDMARAYDPWLRGLACEVASQRGLELGTGVYAGVVGPAYETPAEVAMLRALGADLVGMSTVLEVIAARACGLGVLGLSVVTNVPGAMVTASHDEVLTVGREAGSRLGELVTGVVERLARGRSGMVESDKGRSRTEAVAPYEGPSGHASRAL
ncbi:MAG: purine-nucleoside phosphorylase [Actinomycetota bacterium]|nr:purine-nucleoside phosphorylase [Actinomycetota bacterium]